MKARIKKLDPAVSIPEYHTQESAAFDLAANEDVTVDPKQIKLVKTGLIIEAPENHFLFLAPRSSVAKKKGLMFPHSTGIIDRDYSGPEDEVLIQVYNFTDQPVEIKKGERLAQGLFLPTTKVEWDEVESIERQTRGGVGSTGGYHH